MEFSMSVWRKYCLDRVEANTDEQRARLERLIDNCNPDNEIAWANLAAVVRPLRFIEADGTSYTLQWQEALHNVIGCLIFPPGTIKPTPKEKYRKARDAAIALRKAILDFEPSDQWAPCISTATLDAVIIGAEAALNGNIPLPLIPGKNTGENAARNWLALYLRHRVIIPFFNNPHHEDIARLVNSALGIYSLSPDDVRLMKPRSNSHP